MQKQEAPPTPSAAPQQAPPTPAPVTQPAPAATATSGAQPSRVLISPFARTVAKERGIDLQTANIPGSGTFGSIVSGDLDTVSMPAMQQPSQVGDYEDIPHSQTRKVKECFYDIVTAAATVSVICRQLLDVCLKQRALFLTTMRCMTLICPLCYSMCPGVCHMLCHRIYPTG